MQIWLYQDRMILPGDVRNAAENAWTTAANFAAKALFVATPGVHMPLNFRDTGRGCWGHWRLESRA